MTEDIQNAKPAVFLEVRSLSILRSLSLDRNEAAGPGFAKDRVGVIGRCLTRRPLPGRGWDHPRHPLRLLRMAGLGALWLASSPAAADVLEIGPQGSVTVYAVPTVFTADGAKAIVAPAARRPGPAPAVQVSSLITEASQRYAVPRTLMQAVAWRESRFQQGAVSSKGAIGVMQLMAGTAHQLGVDPYDLRQNIHGGAAYLSQLLTRYRGDTGLALAAYNAGPAMVDRYGGAPPFRETRRYVADILAAYAPSPFMILGQ